MKNKFLNKFLKKFLIIILIVFFGGMLSYEICGDKGSAGDSLTGQKKGEKAQAAEETATEETEPELEEDAESVPKVRKKGWYGKGKKRYYIRKNGKKAKGYLKIHGKYYFFKKTSGYAVVNVWRTVSWKGKKYRFYFTKDGSREMDVSGRLEKKKGVTYLLETNLTTNSVMVYAKWNTKGYDIPVKRMRCSVGMQGHRTVQGTYRLRKTGNRWHVLRYGCYGQYCSRIKGPYLFHSVVYQKMGDKYSLDLAEYKKLGKAASHGCIRLQTGDAKWIYDHAGQCTAHIYEGKKETLPLPYPSKIKAKKKVAGKYYDPTDVN